MSNPTLRMVYKPSLKTRTPGRLITRTQPTQPQSQSLSQTQLLSRPQPLQPSLSQQNLPIQLSFNINDVERPTRITKSQFFVNTTLNDGETVSQPKSDIVSSQIASHLMEERLSFNCTDFGSENSITSSFSDEKNVWESQFNLHTCKFLTVFELEELVSLFDTIVSNATFTKENTFKQKGVIDQTLFKQHKKSKLAYHEQFVLMLTFFHTKTRHVELYELLYGMDTTKNKNTKIKI
ncbi:hypothetical protein EIN_131110 [Entamoeba invadens IP1]|uniref:Uncharacterized protein n=1 Tax=Entamoeba invadens IP1 TaxID=370355 RepID=A0A0A1UD11_ENTIV|nr:hypothetical protein EIN_131110 [Entamoeba invadens IP1]ELP94322.1 hypothetical protein EIN_131110 [Entamoeba invadens IP1]|eukprot:XP_004261093.1 hypothetical protein EIN_131110 [Entamoeba invadens IP1]